MGYHAFDFGKIGRRDFCLSVGHVLFLFDGQIRVLIKGPVEYLYCFLCYIHISIKQKDRSLIDDGTGVIFQHNFT